MEDWLSWMDRLSGVVQWSLGGFQLNYTHVPHRKGNTIGGSSLFKMAIWNQWECCERQSLCWTAIQHVNSIQIGCRVAEHSRLHPMIPRLYVMDWRNDMQNRNHIKEVSEGVDVIVITMTIDTRVFLFWSFETWCLSECGDECDPPGFEPSSHGCNPIHAALLPLSCSAINGLTD